MGKRILVQINCYFDLFIFLGLINKEYDKFEISLLAPIDLIENLDQKFLKYFYKVEKFDPKVKNLLSFKSLIASIKLSIWCYKNKKKYCAIFFGAYRNEITSILTKHFYKKSTLITIKQGVDIPYKNYQSFKNLKTLHDYIYFKFFGFSSFSRARLKPVNKNSYKNDYFFSILKWDKDPFRKKNIYTIGTNNALMKDYSKFILPNLKKINPYNKYHTNGILIIGERTPMTPYWEMSQEIIFKKLLFYIKNEFPEEQLFLRPRKRLTVNKFYAFLNPILLDSQQAFDEQLNKLKPKIVVSVKSTASKVAAYYGYNSLLLYKCLDLKKKELLHLNYLFADGSPVKIPENQKNLISTMKNIEEFKDNYKKEDYFDFNNFFK